MHHVFQMICCTVPVQKYHRASEHTSKTTAQTWRLHITNSLLLFATEQLHWSRWDLSVWGKREHYSLTSSAFTVSLDFWTIHLTVTSLLIIWANPSMIFYCSVLWNQCLPMHQIIVKQMCYIVMCYSQPLNAFFITVEWTGLYTAASSTFQAALEADWMLE